MTSQRPPTYRQFNVVTGIWETVGLIGAITYNHACRLLLRHRRWRIALEGRNLSDKRVLSDAFDLGSNLFAVGAYTDPRTWSLSARYQYE